MTGMLRRAAAAAVAALLLALAGCAVGPDPHEVYDRTGAIFDDLSARLGAVDPTILRTVEVLPAEHEPCGESDGDESQQALVARGSLSVEALDGAAGGILTDLTEVVSGDDWQPVRASGDGERAWSSDDGITVVLSDATPIVVVAVFGPCLPPVDIAAS